CAAAMGFTLHADVAVPALDRRRLERLCRYVARPPVATDRLERLPDGRLLYHLRHRWRDGTTQIVFEPHQLLGRLVPIIPAPRAHQVRYHGVLAPCAGWRDRVVPARSYPGKAARPPRCRNAPDEKTGPGGTGPEGGDRASPPDRRAAEPSTAAGSSRPLRRHAWADQLRRVFAVEVLECPDCGARMRILAAIHPQKKSREPNGSGHDRSGRISSRRSAAATARTFRSRSKLALPAWIR
ncbi:MAG: transposase, partial [Planctomycetes bacterium]|nr:transposase [Planctomycetota bacterium]